MAKFLVALANNAELLTRLYFYNIIDYLIVR